MMEFNELLRRKTKKRFSSFDSLLAPPPKLTVSEDAARHRNISLEESAKPGKWVSWPFQIEMQNVYNEKGVQLAVYMTACQVSKTVQELNLISYFIKYENGGINFMLPTKTMAEDYSQVRFDSMVRDSPALAKILPPTRSKGNKTLFKKWVGGYIRFIGSENANDVCSFATGKVIIDEADRCSLVVRNSKGEIEGNTLQLLFKRMSTFDDKFVLMASTPTTVETSITWEYFQKSDQRHPHIPCPHCGYYQFLDWNNFTWQGKNPNDFNTVFSDDLDSLLDSFCYACQSCNKTFKDSELPLMPDKLEVKWHKHNPKGRFPGFHINQFYTNAWKGLFEEYLSCGQNQIKRMSFWNTVLGLPFSFEGIKVPDHSILMERPKYYERSFVPSPACVLLAGCDVQDDRVEIVVAAVNRRQTYVVDHAVFYGNPANPESECWENLRDYVYKSWQTESGQQLYILAAGIDSRHRKDTVVRFAKKNRVFIPVTGSPSVWDMQLLSPRKAEVNQNGRWFEIDVLRFPLGVNLLKMDLYGRLNLSQTKKQLRDNEYPSDWIHFPKDLSEGFYKQLTGEVLEVNEDARGKTKKNWRKQYTNVEILDCMVYILGIYLIKSLNDWSDARWGAEEAKIGLGKSKESEQSSPIIGSMI
ncbi:MAG: terminase gpA endonuclease subunit [Oligoflexales bacterium]